MEQNSLTLSRVRHEDTCDVCGRCCHQPIPLTLPDVGQLARGLKITDAEAFRRFVSPPHFSRPTVFTQTRNEQGACYFLSRDKRCTVHWFKPRTCALFPCPRLQRVNPRAWAKLYINGLTPLTFWRQKLAERHTRQYLAQHGSRWCARGYRNHTSAYERALAAKKIEVVAERGEDE